MRMTWGGEYGNEAWGVFFASISPDLLPGSILSHGDTDERIVGGPNRPYCWAIAADCSSAEQAARVVDVFSRSTAKGLMPVPPRFATGAVAERQPLIPSARIDERGRFVLLDECWMWVLMRAAHAGWKHALGSSCLGHFLTDFVGSYRLHPTAMRTPTTKLILAATLRETGGPEVLKRALDSREHRTGPQRQASLQGRDKPPDDGCESA